MIDSFNREITYARISVTDRCNLRCAYCMPECGVEKLKHSQILSFEEMEQIVDSLVELGINKIRVTGGEPLVRKGVLNFLEYASKLPQIKTLALTTNGTLLRENAEALKRAGVENINISLDTFNQERYAKITRLGDINEALSGINEAIKCGFDTIKINAVLLKGINDNEVQDFIEFAERYNLEVRFIELMPFTAQSGFASEYFISASEVLSKCPNLTFLGSIDNSTAEYYLSPNGAKIGFISSLSNKFCGRCNRVRVTADGLLIT
ncbi:MAG: GTP 3',8-cyclase MoaA, partial [Clostridia bacterium]